MRKMCNFKRQISAKLINGQKSVIPKFLEFHFIYLYVNLRIMLHVYKKETRKNIIFGPQTSVEMHDTLKNIYKMLMKYIRMFRIITVMIYTQTEMSERNRIINLLSWLSRKECEKMHSMIFVVKIYVLAENK